MLKAAGQRLLDLQECYDATIAERNDGWIDGGPNGYYTLNELNEIFIGDDGKPCWLAHQRNPHRRYPGANVRPVDDCTASGGNYCYSSDEALRCENADYPSRVAMLFANIIPGTPVLHGTDDLTKAYRQCITCQPQFAVVAVWNPTAKRVEFFIVKGFPFGLATAVLQFNRIPQCIVAACRRLLALCVCHYYDDYNLCEPRYSAKRGQFMLRRVHELLGFLLDPTKHISAAESNPFLGVVTDLSVLHQGIIVLKLSQIER